jgi:lipoprotein signal peptidase
MFAKLSVRSAILALSIAVCLSFVVLMVAVCYLIKPELLHHPHWGISYFGTQRETLLPYYGGFTLMLACLTAITYLLRTVTGRWRPVYRLFYVSVVLAMGIAFSSFASTTAWKAVHLTVCFMLLFLLLAAGPWLLRQPGTRWSDYAAYLLLVGGGSDGNPVARVVERAGRVRVG